MITTRWMVPAVVLSIGMLCGQVNAQGRGQGKGGGRGSDTSVSVAVVFRDGDRAMFHDYFVTHKISSQDLPPGIARNVARGRPLPPGIAKRTVPADLLAKGPKEDNSISFAIVGNVVVATKGGVVIDILAGVFR
jgi:hypothetical protein